MLPPHKLFFLPLPKKMILPLDSYVTLGPQINYSVTNTVTNPSYNYIFLYYLLMTPLILIHLLNSTFFFLESINTFLFF